MDYLDIPLASFTDNKTSEGGHLGCVLSGGKLYVSWNIFACVWRDHMEPTTGDLFGHIEMNVPTYIGLLGWSRDEIADGLTELHEYLAARPRDVPAPLMPALPHNPFDPVAIDSGWSRPDNAPPSQPCVA